MRPPAAIPEVGVKLARWLRLCVDNYRHRDHTVKRPQLPHPCVQVALAGGGRGPAAAALPLNRPGAIPRIKASELTYERFCRDFMEMNTPLIVQVGT